LPISGATTCVNSLGVSGSEHTMVIHVPAVFKFDVRLVDHVGSLIEFGNADHTLIFKLTHRSHK
jgi:hypothetical protein